MPWRRRSPQSSGSISGCACGFRRRTSRRRSPSSSRVPAATATPRSSPTLRAVLYGAGYHVLTMPSPTFPGFIVSASSTGVAGDLEQDAARSVRRDGRDHRPPAAQGANHRRRRARLQSWAARMPPSSSRSMPPSTSCAYPPGADDQSAGQPVRHGGPARQALRRSRSERRCRTSSGSISSSTPRSPILPRVRSGRARRGFPARGRRLGTEDRCAVLAAIALTFRIALSNVFFAGDLYSGAGVVTDPAHPPGSGIRWRDRAVCAARRSRSTSPGCSRRTT